MRSRERNLRSDLIGADIGKLLPVIDEAGVILPAHDNAFELLTAAGREP
jgi:glutamate synthase (NADPH/NADH) large chain